MKYQNSKTEIVEFDYEDDYVLKGLLSARELAALMLINKLKFTICKTIQITTSARVSANPCYLLAGMDLMSLRLILQLKSQMQRGAGHLLNLLTIRSKLFGTLKRLENGQVMQCPANRIGMVVGWCYAAWICYRQLELLLGGVPTRQLAGNGRVLPMVAQLKN